MQWQRLLRSAAAVVGAAAVGCESAPSLHAADLGVPPTALVQAAGTSTAARMQKPDRDGTAVTPVAAVVPPDPLHGGRVMTSVRVMVNGHPIFDDEVSEAALGPLASLNPASDGYQAEVKKVKSAALEQLIDRELLIQEAENKLKMAGKKDVLDKVKEEADGQFQRWVKQARAGFKSDDEFKAYLRARGTSYEGQRRLRQRIFLADEYLRSNVMRYVDHRTGHQEILDYYRAHPEEFQRTDSVQWQDIFLDAAQYPNRDAAYRTATEVAARARAGDADDFVKLCEKYDNGLARTKKGAGIGTRRQDINPPEAAAVLFQMRDGEVGPIVSVPAGFHVLRLVKRTQAGLAPFNEEVQKAIKDKLRNEAFALESKRFLEELRQTAHIERVPAGP
jgi:parvulin-like peptidyl-prolyl isomerase